MEGQRHANRYAHPEEPRFNRPQMAARSDGSTDLPRGSSGRRCDRADGMARALASTERHPAVSAPTERHQSGARVIDSKALMDGARTILINHEGQEYTLRLTRLGKLLLTK